MPYLIGVRRMGLVTRSIIGDGASGSDMIPVPISRGGPIFWTGPTGSSGASPMPGPMPVYNPAPPSSPIIIRGPITYNPPVTAPAPSPTLPPVSALPSSAANAGTPVPVGYPTNQMFVDPNGGFWEFSSAQNQWVSVGTPYNTGAGGIPPAAPTGSTPSAPTSLTTPTTAPAPVSTVNVAAPSGTYQDILNWLEEDTLGATIGFSSIPNWIVTAGALALAWRFSSGGKKRNPSRLRNYRRGSR